MEALREAVAELIEPEIPASVKDAAAVPNDNWPVLLS